MPYYVICNCQVYLEHYTSILTVGHQELEKFYERDIILADRWFFLKSLRIAYVCVLYVNFNVNVSLRYVLH